MGYDDEKLTTEITLSAGRTFFAHGYADQAREAGKPLTGDIRDQLPGVTDYAAHRAAWDMANAMIHDNGMWLGAVYLRNKGGLSTEEWGHRAALEALGCPGGLREYVKGVKVPSIPFSGADLTKKYF